MVFSVIGEGFGKTWMHLFWFGVKFQHVANLDEMKNKLSLARFSDS